MLRPYPQPSHRSPPRTGTIMYGRQHAAPLPTTISQITTQNRDNHVRAQHAAPPPTTISQITTQNRDNHVRETACCAPTHDHLTDHHPEPGQSCTGDSMLRPYPQPSHKSQPGTGQSCTGDSMLRPYPRPSHRSPPRTGTTMYGRQHAAPLPTTISQITTQNRDNHVRETACCAPTHNHLTNHNPERDNHVATQHPINSRGAACCAPTSNTRLPPAYREIYAVFFVGRSVDRRSSRSCVTAVCTLSEISRSCRSAAMTVSACLVWNSSALACDIA